MKLSKHFSKPLKLLGEIFNTGFQNVYFIILSIFIGGLMFRLIDKTNMSLSYANSIISSVLTINGVFSALLITYLFTRITWTKDRKLDHFNLAIAFSLKITEFRRILDRLTKYYNVWKYESQTKNLLDFGKFSTLDFYDFRTISLSDSDSSKSPLVSDLINSENYSDSSTQVYLAMVSFVNKRKYRQQWQPELYKDHDVRRVYPIVPVKQWIDSGLMDSISYWLTDDRELIYYAHLNEHQDFIIESAGRINKKYASYKLDNKLIREIAEDMSSHIIPELYKSLEILGKGINGLSLTITILITISLLFGVLIPFFLLSVITASSFFPHVVAGIVSINATFISFFMLKFPFLIQKELKWI